VRERVLPDVAQTRLRARLFASLSENGKQNGGQDRDDRDDDEQFNQGKSFADTEVRDTLSLKIESCAATSSMTFSLFTALFSGARP
jgi:hypothetical protein